MARRREARAKRVQARGAGARRTGGGGRRAKGGGRHLKWWCKGRPAVKSREEGRGDGYLRWEGEKKEE
ncbi:hypothetical protein ACOSQ2_027589 [Xanthoceras sorbifolium]